MMSLINLLLSDSDDSSLRRSSPVERCVNPYFPTSFSHCVPLPEPGPPRKEVMYQTCIPSLVPHFWLYSPWWASLRTLLTKHGLSTYNLLEAVLGDVGTVENGIQSLPSKSLLWGRYDNQQAVSIGGLVGRTSGRYKGYGEGCRTPFGRDASQVQASWGDKSAHV